MKEFGKQESAKSILCKPTEKLHISKEGFLGVSRGINVAGEAGYNTIRSTEISDIGGIAVSFRHMRIDYERRHVLTCNNLFRRY